MLGQRAPSMNVGKKVPRSAYGRPLYKMITGKDVPKELWCDIDDVLMIDKGIVEASMKDIEHTFCCYEHLQKEIHVGVSKGISRFTEDLSSPAKKIISDGTKPFGKSITEVVIRVINCIADSKRMTWTVAEVVDLAIRPCSQFMQDKSGNIKQSVRDNRMRQAAIVSALMLANKGLVTIISTKRFSTQN